MALDIGNFSMSEQGWYALPFLVIMFLSSITSLAITKVAIKGSLFTPITTTKRDAKPTKIHLLPKYLSLACVIGFTICNVTQLLALCLYIFGIDFLVPWTTGDSYVWFIGKYIMYPLFIARLYVTFGDSQYQYKWYHPAFCLCYFLLILQLIGNYFWNYYYSINKQQMVLIWSVIVYFTDPAYCVVITHMFIRKLNQLRKDTCSTTIHRKLIETMAKFTILTFIAVFSSVISVIIACIRWYFVNATWMWISSLFVSLDCAISSVAIVYCFSFAHGLYTKHCKMCDTVFKLRILRQEEKKISFVITHTASRSRQATETKGSETPQTATTMQMNPSTSTVTTAASHSSTVYREDVTVSIAQQNGPIMSVDP